MENDDNITFETMPDFGGMFRSGATSKTQVVEEKEYEFLYDELLDKCNPSKFKIESVGLEKFNVANEIYAQLKSGGSDVPEGILITLRNRAMDELGVYISTKKKFDHLKSIFDPEIYINRVPYNEQRVREAGKWYEQILKSANDIRALEVIESNAMDFIQDEERQKDEQSRAKMVAEEEAWFKHQSANDYIGKYPNGIHAEEARYYINNRSRAYLKKYPEGRYVDDASTSIAGGIFAIAIVVVVVIVIVASASSK